MPFDLPATNDTGAELIFVLGLPHAGVAQIAQVLGLSDEIHAGTAPWLMLPLRSLLRWNGVEADYDAFAARQALERFSAELPHGMDDVAAAVRTAALTLYRAALAKSGKRIFVDATPRYTAILPWLATVFPAARFIVALRNPAAVLHAHVSIACDGDLSRLREHEDLYRDLVDAPRHLAQALPALGERAVRVHYEDWAGDSHRLAQQLAPQFALPVTSSDAPHSDAAIEADLRQVASTVLQRMRGDDPHAALIAVAQTYLDFLGADTLAALGYGGAAHGLALALDCGESLGYLLQAPLPALAEHNAAADAQSLNASGEALFAEGRVDDAAAAFLYAAHTAPAAGAPLNNLGALFWQNDQKALALWCFARGARLEPDFNGAWLNLCAALTATGERASAKALLTQLMTLRPDDPEIMQAYLTS